MIAEAWARRRYQAAFVNNMNEAMAEAAETQAWLDHSLDCEHLNLQQHSDLNQQWQGLGGMLSRTIDRSADFCRSSKEK